MASQKEIELEEEKGREEFYEFIGRRSRDPFNVPSSRFQLLWDRKFGSVAQNEFSETHARVAILAAISFHRL